MAVILITGTSTGIGLATAVAFGRSGQEVYATMRNPNRAPELASIAEKERLPIKVLPMDVDNDAVVIKAVAGILAASGRIDVLVNNVGISVTVHFWANRLLISTVFFFSISVLRDHAVV